MHLVHITKTVFSYWNMVLARNLHFLQLIIVSIGATRRADRLIDLVNAPQWQVFGIQDLV